MRSTSTLTTIKLNGKERMITHYALRNISKKTVHDMMRVFRVSEEDLRWELNSLQRKVGEPLGGLPVSTRALNTLIRMRITPENIDDLAKYTWQDIRKVKDCGKKTANEICDYAESIGINIKKDWR